MQQFGLVVLHDQHFLLVEFSYTSGAMLEKYCTQAAAFVSADIKRR